MKYLLLIGFGVFLVSGTSSYAQDATCAKAKNPKHRAACNCNVSGGGYAQEQPGGGIRWFGPRGGSQAVTQCLANIK